MSIVGLDRWTGCPLAGSAHVVQCVDVIFTAHLGELAMLRWFGASLVDLLGRRAMPRNLSLYRTLITGAITAWEPRLAVVTLEAGGTSGHHLTLGRLHFVVLCHYRPNALKGDLTVERRQILSGAIECVIDWRRRPRAADILGLLEHEAKASSPPPAGWKQH